MQRHACGGVARFPASAFARSRMHALARTAARPAEDVALVAERLAEFVAKNGRQFEEMTRARNPGDTPFKCVRAGGV
jgi:hypothetical protein